MITIMGNSTKPVASIIESREASYETALRVARDIACDAATGPRTIRVEVEDLGEEPARILGREVTRQLGAQIRVFRDF